MNYDPQLTKDNAIWHRAMAACAESEDARDGHLKKAEELDRQVERDGRQKRRGGK